MSDRRFRLTIAVLATAGIAIAAYLSYTRATDTSLICPTSGCGKVQQSSYSELAGVPVAYLGVAGYALILAAAQWTSVRAVTVTAVLTLAGAGFALYLLALQLFVIDAVCTWCVTSDAVLIAITGLAFARVHARMREGRRRRPSSLGLSRETYL
jgi:uncharacterized membrane protein